MKEFYKELHLYTDSQGENILISKLGLPYTKVNNVYDKIETHASFWAISKILTYANQKEPFIQIDGDVFIWKLFSKEIEYADLIAQNKEIGTKYYSNMMNTLVSELDYLPNILRKEIEKKSISSYNAGILGGNDIIFFEKYTKKALRLIEKNKHFRSDKSNYNILFEQILFYIMAKECGKKITC